MIAPANYSERPVTIYKFSYVYYVATRVLKKIFAAKSNEVTGQWRRMHAKLYDLYCSPSIIRVVKSRRLKWAGHVASKGESRGAYRVFVGRPRGKRPLGKPRRRWEDNIKMDLIEMGLGARTGLLLLRKGTGGGRL
jgi:hypothetical protein